MKLTEILNEKLEDIAIRNILTHKTNAENLFKIFVSGYLKGFNYNSGNTTSTWDEPHPKYRKEIATARTTSKIKDKELSREIGKVTFYLYKDRLQSFNQVRNLKIKPIAELPLYGKKDLIDYVYNFFDEYGIGSNEKNTNIFVDELIKSGITKENYFEILPDLIYKFYNKRVSNNGIKELWKAIKGNMIYVKHYLKPETKESEERIVAERLPLNKKVMNIRLEDGFLEELKAEVELSKPEIKNLVDKYKDLIQNTPEKTKLLNYLYK